MLRFSYTTPFHTRSFRPVRIFPCQYIRDFTSVKQRGINRFARTFPSGSKKHANGPDAGRTAFGYNMPGSLGIAYPAFWV